MGTSSEDRGGAGGSWTPAKIAATGFAKHGGNDRAGRALGRLVTALGGATAIASAATRGRIAAQRAGALYVAAADAGLGSALERLGLGEVVGRSAEEVVDALVDYVGGAGETREAQAARDAACDLFEELADADTFEGLERELLEIGGVSELLGRFLAAYIYRLLLPVIDDRLDRLDNDDLKARRDHEARETILAIVRLRLAQRDLEEIDWTGDAAGAVVDELLEDCLVSLEDLGA